MSAKNKGELKYWKAVEFKLPRFMLTKKYVRFPNWVAQNMTTYALQKFCKKVFFSYKYWASMWIILIFQALPAHGWIDRGTLFMIELESNLFQLKAKYLIHYKKIHLHLFKRPILRYCFLFCFRILYSRRQIIICLRIQCDWENIAIVWRLFRQIDR